VRSPDPLPNHDQLHAAAMHRMDWEARAQREVGRSYEREEGKVANTVVDTGIEGAQAARDSVRAHVKRRLKSYTFYQDWKTPQEAANTAVVIELERILKWLEGQAKRAAAKPGGIQSSRRRAAKGKGGKDGKGGGKGAK
jgi:hypothetical protein